MNSGLVISFFDCCKSEEKIFSCKGECTPVGEFFHLVTTFSSGVYFSFSAFASESAWRFAEKGEMEFAAVCIQVSAAAGKIKRRFIRTFHSLKNRFSFTGRRFLEHTGILRI